MVGDKNSLSSISSQEGHFLKAFNMGILFDLDEINLTSQLVIQCIEKAFDLRQLGLE